MITLVDVIGKIKGIRLGRNYKIHLAKHKKDPPIEAYFAGAFKEWQEDQKTRTLNVI